MAGDRLADDRGAPRLLSRRLGVAVLAGSLSGLVVLGIGGRVVMRALAYTTTTPPRFSVSGTLQVLLLGAAWGALTAPGWLALSGLRLLWVRILLHGATALGLALVALAVIAASGGPVVAPLSFFVLGTVLFPLLFLLHAVLVDRLARRWDAAAG